MNVLENYSGYEIDDILAVTSRINNKRRNYLLLNKVQAKYIPTNAVATLDMFERLAARIKGINGNVIVVGFAETATAIGARIAYSLNANNNNITSVTSLTTTREKRNITPICEFKEEHSHAVEQILYGTEEMFKNADWIIFAEDEVTTGNTIRNCVSQLREKYTCRYAVASILNCMSDKEMELFTDMDIHAFYLIKTDKEGLDKEEPKCYIKNMLVSFPDIRLGVNPQRYEDECNQVADMVMDKMNDDEFKSLSHDGTILVLGTEECMYPSIKVAEQLTNNKYKAFVSATTRVPTSIEGPLTSRNKVRSLYGERDTYLYNLNHYDIAVIVTDAGNPAREIINLMWDKYGISKILVVNLEIK